MKHSSANRKQYIPIHSNAEAFRTRVVSSKFEMRHFILSVETSVPSGEMFAQRGEVQYSLLSCIN